ncbi:MAG: flagellar hook-associated protein FlgK [Paracoccus sp. (in: a-proteobacteria)]
MSMTRAISNAMSGLSATARGTELVAANLANVMTPGYARRELAISPQSQGSSLGGVRVDGVVRAVNAGLLSEARAANSSQSEASTRARFQSSMEAVVGLPGEAHALATALSDFQVALSSASARPEDEIRLARVLDTASTLAGRLNAAGSAVQNARTAAEQSISADINSLNASLDRVAYLNRHIVVVTAQGKDPSSLLDERQQLITGISSIVPVHEVARDNGTVALFTQSGAVLLDGTSPSRFSFQPTGQIQPDHVAGAPLSFIVQDGAEITPGQMRMFAGGSLAGHFAVRDNLGPQLQLDLDELAFDLQARLADPQVDATLLPGQAGLFTDAGQPADASALAGLSLRIAVTAAVDPDQGGHLWKIRAGLNATTGDPVSDSTLLNAAMAALNASRPSVVVGASGGNASLASRFGQVAGRVSADRVDAQAELALKNARLTTTSSLLLADGVDSDSEMQRLLQYEQAYAANARVIRAIDEMINQILRI